MSSCLQKYIQKLFIFNHYNSSGDLLKLFSEDIMSSYMLKNNQI